MKYLYNTDWYKPGNPIFFYTGNEGYVEGFAENTGIIWDLAQHFNACVVFAEHRYYSNDSQYKPFGDLAYKNATYLGYLTSEQALADYARFIPWFKTNVLNCNSDTPVIAFGGSYGGMLATWFRLKYPTVVNGSWASSADVTDFKNGGTELGAFDHKATQTFLDSGCSFNTIVKAFSALDTFANNLTALNNIFHAKQGCLLTNASVDIFTLKTWVRYAFEYMAMTDYPYYTNFFMPMPAWPVSEMCKHLGNLSTEQLSNNTELATRLFRASTVYYSNNTVVEGVYCLIDTSEAVENLGNDLGWPWQECTEIPIYLCAQGPNSTNKNDVFWQDCTDENFIANMTASCVDIFTPNPPVNFTGYNESLLRVNGIQNLYGFDFSRTSNIIFTNGNLDPVSASGVNDATAGINNSNSRGIYSFYIDGAAHHLDLRQPNSCDPPSVVNARYQIVQIISCWINPSCTTQYQQQPLPSFSLANANSTNCRAIQNGYPWGQSSKTTPSNSGSSSVLASVLTLLLAIILFCW
uniref:Uncharacterized protein n=1 Tax=Acrobeloides nanus TaxID=290746 RepID=A0A914DBU8_9BILA